MHIAIPIETHPHERRVAATPESVKKLIGLGYSVCVEAGAGSAACFPDSAYEQAGASVVADPAALYADADLLLKVRPPHVRPDVERHELDLCRDGVTVASFVFPAREPELLQRFQAKKATALALDQVPRITRAQKMDALSSMANIAGYRAVIEAAHHFGSFFTGQMTAAGKVAPAKVLVIGAGVAGLSALGTAKGLGAIVRAFDTRSAARDQVTSMGAEFLEVALKEEGEAKGGYSKEMSPAFIAAEMALFRKQATEVDIVITTALIPGKPAPKLWLRDMVEAMKPGSVVVDLAAETGGNCELTVPDEVVVREGVTIIGRTDLTSRLATTASQLYAQNLVHLLNDIALAAKGAAGLDFADDVVYGACVVHAGEVRFPVAPREPAAKPAAPAAAAESNTARHTKSVTLRTPALKFAAELPAPKTDDGKGSARRAPLTWAMVAIVVLSWLALHYAAGHEGEDPTKATALFLERLTVFVLSCFVGWQVIWNVTPALHTPLMSVTNAISGIILIGGLLHTVGEPTSAPVVLGVLAVWLATVNVAGGFLVTRRMLKMFRK